MPEIVIGIAVALMVFEITGYAPGGIITTGYLCLYFHNWQFIAGTLIVSLITWLLVKGLSNIMVLYGRRLFSVYLLTGLLISQLLPILVSGVHTKLELATIGYLLPGLIAKDAGKQGWLPTMGSLLISVGLTRIIFLAGKGIVW